MEAGAGGGVGNGEFYVLQVAKNLKKCYQKNKTKKTTKKKTTLFQSAKPEVSGWGYVRKKTGKKKNAKKKDQQKYYFKKEGPLFFFLPRPTLLHELD